MPDEPMSTIEIARVFEVEAGTVHSWRQRGIFPEPDRMVSNTPIWFASTVTAWAKTHGRPVQSPDYELAATARQAEDGISALGSSIERAAHTGGDRGWTQALDNVVAALVPLGQVVTELARARDAATRAAIDDAEELKGLARDEIRKLVGARFRSWARLVESESEGLANAAFQAAMEPSLTYTYPIEGDEHSTMYLSDDLRAFFITADGAAATLKRIAQEHARIVAQVRAWDVWRRVRPGPI